MLRPQRPPIAHPELGHTHEGARISTDVERSLDSCEELERCLTRLAVWAGAALAGGHGDECRKQLDALRFRLNNRRGDAERTPQAVAAIDTILDLFDGAGVKEHHDHRSGPAHGTWI